MRKLMRQTASVTEDGKRLATLPDGVSVRDVVTHTDERGTVFELIDARWDWCRMPLVFSYCCTVRPGYVKGWGMHREHDDRYCTMFGEMMVVLFDGRADSPTKGLVAEVSLTEHHRRMLYIPIGVWHAVHNVGSRDVVFVNFPTKPYDHADPDKYTMPLVNDVIPYRFENARA